MVDTLYSSLDKKIIQMFSIIGLNENKIMKYDEKENNIKYIQNIDIVKKIKPLNSKFFHKENEKWLLLNDNTNYWLRIQYSKIYDNPITGLRIIECDKYQDRLLYDMNESNNGYYPIMVDDLESEFSNPNASIDKELLDMLIFNDNFYSIPIELNVREILKLSTDKLAVLAVSRLKSSLPLIDIEIIENSGCSKKIGVHKSKDPLNLKFLPDVIDVYPTDYSFNPGIAMFCFPEGMTIRKYSDLPRCFSFSLTGAMGERSYATCLIFTEELQRKFLDSLVPSYYPKDQYFVEKAICIIGNYPFFNNYKVFLKEIYRIQVSHSTSIPLERIICHFVDSLYLKMDKQICYQIADKSLKFYSQPLYAHEWDIKDESVEILFILLSVENIMLIWEALLLERKVFLISKNKENLLNCCMALISLIFPFKWIHVMIPILPEKLRVFTDAPVPLLTGICYNCNYSEFPTDAIIMDLDKNKIENYNDKLPKLPNKLYSNMIKRLEKTLSDFNRNDENRRNKVLFAEDVFGYSEEFTEVREKFNTAEVRDIFYEFFVLMFKNYEKYFPGIKNRKIKNGQPEPITFNRDYFLKDHSSLEASSFLFKFTETIIFTEFEENFRNETHDIIQFFRDSIKKDKKKEKYYLPYRLPTYSTLIPEITTIEKDKSYTYDLFKLNSDYYIKIDSPKINTYSSKFNFGKDEWCYEISKLTNKEWNKFMIYSIYEIWFHLFSNVIQTYDNPETVTKLVFFALHLLNDLNKKKIEPCRSIYTKIVKSCSRPYLKKILKDIIFKNLPSNILNSPLFANAYMNGIYDKDQNIKIEDCENLMSSKFLFKASIMNLRNSIIYYDNLNKSTEQLQDRLNSNIFLTYDYCPNCLKKKSRGKLTIEELLAGFKKEKNSYYSVCNICLSKVFPKLYMINNKSQPLDDIESVNFLSPYVLMKEIDNIIKNNGDKYFYISDYFMHKEHKHIFWNLVFYFQLLNLPRFVLYVLRDEEKINLLIDHLDFLKSCPEIKSNNISNKNSECDSRKLSSASNDMSSVFSYPTIKTNTSNFENFIQVKIKEKVDSSFYESEIDSKAEKGEIMQNLSEIRQLISKSLEEFHIIQKGKLNEFCKEFEDETISERNINLEESKIVQFNHDDKLKFYNTNKK